MCHFPSLVKFFFKLHTGICVKRNSTENSVFSVFFFIVFQCNAFTYFPSTVSTAYAKHSITYGTFLKYVKIS